MARIICFISIILVEIPLVAQMGRNMTRKEYIDTYKELAIKEMHRSGIPASITLAQGLLESGEGNSSLARTANNHFGIKCHGWKGKSVKHDDDEKGECFRKYKSVEESYRDHSDFLMNGSRYKDLFNIPSDDYKAWARGLKKAGYATSPTYADALIRIIEENKLYQYDREIKAGKEPGHKIREAHEDHTFAGGRKVHYNNRIKYVIAREGDSFYSLSEELDLFEWQLPKYNDLPERKIFSEGEIVYLQPKRNRAEAGINMHVVEAGETLQSISQKYGIKLSKLAERNLISADSIPLPGTVLLLRGKKEGAGEKMNDTLKMPKLKNKEKPKEEFIIEFDTGE